MIEHEMNSINSKRIDKNQHEWYSIDKKLGRITRLSAVESAIAVATEFGTVNWNKML